MEQSQGQASNPRAENLPALRRAPAFVRQGCDAAFHRAGRMAWQGPMRLPEQQGAGERGEHRPCRIGGVGMTLADPTPSALSGAVVTVRITARESGMFCPRALRIISLG